MGSLNPICNQSAICNLHSAMNWDERATLRNLSQSLHELRRAHERDEQLLELDTRLAKGRQRLSNGIAVAARLETAERVAEHLLDDALLARRAGGKEATDLLRLRERRVRQPGDLALAVDRQLNLPGRRPSSAAFELDRQPGRDRRAGGLDRKSTRLNSSHF